MLILNYVEVVYALPGYVFSVTLLQLSYNQFLVMQDF